MVQPVWSGMIELGPLQTHVLAYAAIEDRRAGTSLVKLHAGCHERIRTRRICSTHGELEAEEVVLGYELQPGRYIALDWTEVDKLQPAPSGTISIDEFVSPGSLNPAYFAGRAYYLLPAPPADASYRVLQQAMLDEDVCGLAQMVIRDREFLMAMRPVGQLLTLCRLYYDDAVRPAHMFDTDVAAGSITARAVAQARGLIREQQVNDPHSDAHPDPYRQRLSDLIEQKLADGDVDRPVAKILDMPSPVQKQREYRRARGTLKNGKLSDADLLSPRRKAK